MLQNKIYQPPTPKTRTSSGVPSIFKKSLRPIDTLKTSRDCETLPNSEFTCTPRQTHRKTLSLNQKYPLTVQQSQITYSAAFRKADLEKAIDSLIDVMVVYALRDNIEGIFHVYFLIAETYLRLGDAKSGIQVYYQLLQLCDICNDVEAVQKRFRIKTLQRLASFAHQMKFYDLSIKFRKKELQYAWFIQDRYSEIQCFDKLGQSEYMQADLEKASFYHQRSIWGRTEPPTSNHYQIAVNNVESYLKRLPKNIIHIDNMLLSKATFLPFAFAARSQKSPEGQSQYLRQNQHLTIIKQPHRFSSQVPLEAAFAKVLSLPIFEFEMSTPRQAPNESQGDSLRISPQELFMSILMSSKAREERLYFKKLRQNANSLGGFVPPANHRTKCKASVRLDKKLLKQPLDEMVTERLLSHTEAAEDVSERFKATKMNHIRAPLRNVVRISHLSPNRDLQSYGECLQVQTNPEKLFVSNVLF